MIGRIKMSARDMIAANRHSRAITSLRSFTSFVESAWLNEGASFDVNGERDLLRRLSKAQVLTAFDVGANDGDWLLGALAAWPSCHIHAFEVAPTTFEHLENRLAMSGHASRASLNCLGLSDIDGTREMYYYPDHPELTSDLRRHNGYRISTFEAGLARGDSYARERGIETVDFLKIDVEGAEHLVMKGMGDYLSSGRIQCIQFEYGAFSIQTRVLLADYYSLLGPNYWIGKIYPSGVEFTDYHWTMENFRFANYFCVLKGRPDLRDAVTSPA
jgi:FkbM family methyltransferase